MSCYNPKLCFVNPKGGRPIWTNLSWSTFVKENNETNYYIQWDKVLKTHPHVKALEPIKLPCGKCEQCRLNNARDYTTRAICELEEKGSGVFLTLTYNDQNLPPGGIYNEQHIKSFTNALRERVRRETGSKITHFGCAEYGSKKFRPHFHLCIFGWEPDVADRIPWRQNQHSPGFSYRHPLFEELWPYGHIEGGSLTPQSISYTARYVQKKAMNRALPENLQDFPEKKICISRRPGIGAAWLDKTQNNVFEQNFVFDLKQQKKLPVPRYFFKRLEKAQPEKYLAVKAVQKENRLHYNPKETKKYLAQFKLAQSYKIKRLKRGYENDN